ncbi:MAG: hypothetical protein QOF11_870, partial [Chloroflexota bacterium]|nr:hypothetical protein [Chloroflexota bacterium]
DRIHGLLSAPVEIAQTMVPVGVSLGLAVDTAETRQADDLLGAADVAMYRAKAAGKGTIEVASPGSPGLGLPPGRAGVRRPRSIAAARLDEGLQAG